MKVLNDINLVNNINFQTKNKIEKLKLFFAEGSSGSFFRQFLVRLFESMKFSEETRRN